jgi:glycosyltransferase involved in cell wall biosynthesis
MNALLARALGRELRTREATSGTDILLCEFALPFGVSVCEAAAAHGVPYVVHLRGDDVWVWPQESTERLRSFIATVTGARLVLSVSQSLLDEARRIVGGTLPPSAVVPNGIDLARLRPPASEPERAAARAQFGVRAGELVVLCVADALVRKGWPELIEALGRIAQARGPIVLLALEAREGGELDLADLVARHAPSVRLIRRVGLSGHDLVAAYQAADVFCLASHWEGMSNALLEALAAGLPVVATAVAGHPEVVTDGQEGYLVPLRNVDALTEALVAILESDERRRRMGVAARVRAEGVGDSDRAGHRVASLLRAVVNGEADSTLTHGNPYAPSVDHRWATR